MEIIIDPPGEPAHNMARDEEIARLVREGKRGPTLRIYRWDRPAVSIGRRQSLEELPSNLVGDGLPIVRRPTGGGAVLHRLDELTYALAIPSGHLSAGVRLNQLPGILHQQLREELVSRRAVSWEELTVVEKQRESNPLGSDPFCFSNPVCGDLLYRGRKVAGSALRVWRDGLLLQGSIQGLPLGFTPLANTLIFTHYTLISV